MEIIRINEFNIPVTRKRVKNISLRIARGEVKITAPPRVPLSEIERFAKSKYDWIKKHISAAEPRDFNFVTDGKIKIFGESLDTCLFESQAKIYLKKALILKIDERLPYWAGVTGLIPSGYTVRDMKSRWGTCNIGTKKLCFNLQLVKFPPVCLDYVIVHELGHILNRLHDKKFYAYMDKYFPDWKAVKKLLDGNY